MGQASYKKTIFQYASPNGLIEAWLLRPKYIESLSTIMFFRGGYKQFGSINDDKVQIFIRPLVEAGFTVVASQYSGGLNSEGVDEYGGNDVVDSIALFEYLQKHQLLCGQGSVGVLGVSRGAMMALQAMRDGLSVSRAAFIGGLYDCRNTRQERPDLYAMWKEKEVFNVDDVGELNKRSAVTFASRLPNVPYLFMHSRLDSRVPFVQCEKMLSMLPHSAESFIVEGDDHGLVECSHERNTKLIDWFSS